MSRYLKKIISGGQTGVDRAALDVAIIFNFTCGGWCPKGRKAEDGPIDDRYPLKETPSEDYAQRTEWNVRDADATLILAWGKTTGGTAQTVDLAKEKNKLHIIVDLSLDPDVSAMVDWVNKNRIHTLNVAGPRESKHLGIYDAAFTFIEKLMQDIIQKS